MYLDHFSLTEFPFGITPDTRFTFESKAQREAIETLLVALKMGEGFVKVTGERALLLSPSVRGIEHNRVPDVLLVPPATCSPISA